MEVEQHAGDPHYRRTLAAADYQLVLTAATALEGTPIGEAASPALLAALDWISIARSETSRDPRVAILVRLRETGSPALAARLVPYLEDFDPAVADSAAAILTHMDRHRAAIEAAPGADRPVTRNEVEALRGVRLRFVMRTGRWFEVELLVDEAPVTAAARIMRLVKRRYYDDLTFHRVAPNFVLQGGSPGANEYPGFPRSCGTSWRPHCTRGEPSACPPGGRDTGDGQIFINLRDNPRLDYDYTVWEG